MAEANDNTVNEEPKVLTLTEKVDDKDVEKKYLILYEQHKVHTNFST